MGIILYWDYCGGLVGEGCHFVGLEESPYSYNLRTFIGLKRVKSGLN